MTHAIATLEIAKDIATNNEPIHTAAGDFAQAELCHEQVIDFTNAIEVLRAADLPQTPSIKQES